MKPKPVEKVSQVTKAAVIPDDPVTPEQKKADGGCVSVDTGKVDPGTGVATV